MKRWIPLFLIFLGMIVQPDAAPARSIPLTEYNALRHVEVSREGDDLMLRFDFKNPIQQKLVPHYFKRSVQLDFSLTYVDPPKRHYEIKKSPVTQVYVSQFDSRLMRVRFILAEENGLNKRHFEFNKEGNSLEVRIKNPGSAYDEELDQLIQRAVGSSSSNSARQESIQLEVEEAEPEAPVVKKIKRAGNKPTLKNEPLVSKNVEAIGELEESKIPSFKKSTPLKLKDEIKEPLLLAGSEKAVEDNSLWESGMKMLTTLAFVVGLMFFLFYVFKKLVAKQGMFGTADKPIRVISTGFLGPKKSIAMVEVAGRVLILGVANDQITLLSSLEDEEEVARILNNDSKGKNGKRVHSENNVSKNEMPQDKKIERDSKPDVYTRRKKSAPSNPSKVKTLAGPFSKYVKQFSNSSEGNNQAVNDLKRMIRHRSGKVEVGV